MSSEPNVYHLFAEPETVPCAACAAKDDLLARMNDDLVQRTEHITRLETAARGRDAVDIDAEKANTDVLKREVARLRRELTDALEMGPTAIAVSEVLDYWHQDHPRAAIPLSGQRAAVVRKAIGLGHTHPRLPCPYHDAPKGKRPKGARCTVVDELKEAVEYVRMYPFVLGGRRVAEGKPGARRHDCLVYALTETFGKDGRRVVSERAIESKRAIVRRVHAQRFERLHAQWEVCCDVAGYWGDLAMAAAREYDAALAATGTAS